MKRSGFVAAMLLVGMGLSGCQTDNSQYTQNIAPSSPSTTPTLSPYRLADIAEQKKDAERARVAAAAQKKQDAIDAKEERIRKARELKEAAKAEREQRAYEESIALRGDDVALKTGYKIVHEEYGRYITGIVVNESESALRYAEVNFEITDDNGNALESAMDNITYLAPKSSWRFKCHIITDEALRYRPVSVESTRAD